MRTKFLLPALLALTAVSCVKTGSRQEMAGDASRIIFAASEKNGVISIHTKADPVTSLSAFYVTASTGSVGAESSAWDNVSFAYDSEGELYAGDKFWPVVNPSYHFRASNVVMSFEGGDATISASNTTDAVCAYLPTPAYRVKNTLTFEHIFARIGKVTVTAQGGYTISNLSMTLTPKVRGTYNLRMGSGHTDGTGWSDTTDGSPVTVCSHAAAIGPSESYEQENDVWLVPGTYVLSASWTATKDNYSERIRGAETTVDLAAGKVNALAANIVGNASAISLGVSLTAWSANDVEMGTIFPIAPLPGVFSVSSMDRGRFSKGNLQAVIGSGPDETGYNYTASEWRFAANQWESVGDNPGNTSFAVGTAVDLFGWVGASASYDSYGLCTYSTHKKEYYGNLATDELKTEWGQIPGVVSALGTGWRILSSDEWTYLFESRTGASSKWGHGTIDGARGTILLPDSWSLPASCSFTPGNSSASNVYTSGAAAQNSWLDMEEAGAVFFPLTGSRAGTTVYQFSGLLPVGTYWSSTVYDTSNACNAYLEFGEDPWLQADCVRSTAMAVRLVKQL